MKRMVMLGFMAAALSVGLVFSLQAGEGKTCSGSGSKKQGARGKGGCEAMKAAKVEVTNTESGVIVDITSDAPAVVKLIQDCWAGRSAGYDMAARCGTGGGHSSGGSSSKEGSSRCPMKDKSAKHGD